jgi:hypothetical protein
MDKEEEKRFMREQHKKIKQELNRKYVLEPNLEKKKKELQRDLTDDEKRDTIFQSYKEIKKRNEEKGI